MMSKSKWFSKCALIGIVVLLALGAVTMLLWNWLVPALFQGPPIGFAQALGLLLLTRILFGGWSGRRWGSGAQHSWKHRYYEKLSAMSPEERERFKVRMREKWRCGPPAETHEAGHSNV